MSSVHIILAPLYTIHMIFNRPFQHVLCPPMCSHILNQTAVNLSPLFHLSVGGLCAPLISQKHIRARISFHHVTASRCLIKLISYNLFARDRPYHRLGMSMLYT